LCLESIFYFSSKCKKRLTYAPMGRIIRIRPGNSAKAMFPEKPMKPVRKIRTIETARTRQLNARQMVRKVVDAQNKRDA